MQPELPLLVTSIFTVNYFVSCARGFIAKLLSPFTILMRVNMGVFWYVWKVSSNLFVGKNLIFDFTSAALHRMEMHRQMQYQEL